MKDAGCLMEGRASSRTGKREGSWKDMEGAVSALLKIGRKYEKSCMQK